MPLLSACVLAELSNLYNEAAQHYAWKKWATTQQRYSWRLRIRLILEEPDTSRAAKAFAWISAVAIVAQVILIMLETGSFGAPEEGVAERRYERADLVLSVLFTIELVMRTATTPCNKLWQSVFWWIDVVGVLPFYFELALSLLDTSGEYAAVEDIRGLLRLLRVVRVLKVIRHHPDSRLLSHALYVSARPLVVPFTFLLIGAVFFGSFVFYFERLEMRYRFGADENGTAYDEGNFPDIGNGIWFMLVTFSTVGYGDLSPASHSGKAITSLAIISGLIFMSMPLTIVGTNFSKVWEDKEKTSVVVKIQEHLIDRNLSITDVQAIFEEADLDTTGVINLREFSLFLDQMCLEPRLTPSQMRSLFTVFDENNTGFISFFEFCHVVFPDMDIEAMVAEGGTMSNIPEALRQPSGVQLIPRNNSISSQSLDISAISESGGSARLDASPIPGAELDLEASPTRRQVAEAEATREPTFAQAATCKSIQPEEHSAPATLENAGEASPTACAAGTAEAVEMERRRASSDIEAQTPPSPASPPRPRLARPLSEGTTVEVHKKIATLTQVAKMAKSSRNLQSSRNLHPQSAPNLHHGGASPEDGWRALMRMHSPPGQSGRFASTALAAAELKAEAKRMEGWVQEVVRGVEVRLSEATVASEGRLHERLDRIEAALAQLTEVSSKRTGKSPRCSISGGAVAGAFAQAAKASEGRRRSLIPSRRSKTPLDDLGELSAPAAGRRPSAPATVGKGNSVQVTKA